VSALPEIADDPSVSFIVLAGGLVEEILDNGDTGRTWTDQQQLYAELIEAGYPAAHISLDYPENGPKFLDLAINPTVPAPEVTAYQVHEHAEYREIKMGEASVVFLRWWAEHKEDA